MIMKSEKVAFIENVIFLLMVNVSCATNTNPNVTILQLQYKYPTVTEANWQKKIFFFLQTESNPVIWHPRLLRWTMQNWLCIRNYSDLNSMFFSISLFGGPLDDVSFVPLWEQFKSVLLDILNLAYYRQIFLGQVTKLHHASRDQHPWSQTQVLVCYSTFLTTKCSRHIGT